MDRSLHERMGKKFDICYMLAKENLPFRKYPVGTSTSAVEQESDGELPFCFSLLKWDVWFGDTDSTDSDISDN